MQCFLAKVCEIYDDGKYAVLLDKLERPMLLELPSEKHGKINSAFLEKVYQEDDIKKDLVPPESVLVGDKVLLHLLYNREDVIRWNKVPIPE